uniref:Uncharacterized protein n=1 Tax=Utricularia reniformis TaxID=192314 RepID=A0A1Y0B4M9_9LAMI|nr:hypothetical protein AEK19_MT2197 [Utricularia reniformis]ART32344.1 hypothetical protein AEK19_MT2197 [Utricularia reniformis]
MNVHNSVSCRLRSIRVVKASRKWIEELVIQNNLISLLAGYPISVERLGICS